jgi:hypothetical protein
MNFDDDTDEREQFRKKSADVSRILRERPHDSIVEIKKFGFDYVSDGEDDAAEIVEERSATPNTDQQKRLLIFLEGSTPPSDTLVLDYLIELERAEPNYPLFRRRFG